MGAIRKKTVRPGEGGVKYVCDVCSVDITNTVRVRCADKACADYDLCVLCFSNGKGSGNHIPQSHPYRVIEQNSVPIYTPDWGADEELLLLEGAEIYGLGSWADIADHIGNFRDKDEVRDHYIQVYVNSPDFPLPKRSLSNAFDYSDENLRTNFQQAKKRRIEERKEKAKNAPPATPKTKPTASVPSCHEVQGYMPGRLEFETEFANEAEEAVMHMQFDPGDGINQRGELEPEMDLKMTVMDIYNHKLTQRVERKKIIFEHGLLNYRANQAIDKKRTKDERDLLNKAKPFARMMNHDEFKEFSDELLEEHQLRAAIRQLQEWRLYRITDLKSGDTYEKEKAERQQRSQPMGSLDRERNAMQRNKASQPIDVPSGAATYLAPDLPLRVNQNSVNISPSDSPMYGYSGAGKQRNLTNGSATPTPRPRIAVQPVPGVQPLVLNNENAPSLHILTKEEIDLCKTLRIQPKPYIAIKEAIVKEAVRVNGLLKKKHVRELCHLDSQKGGRIFEFFVANGWISKA